MYYFDNAATTVQKPAEVAQAVYQALCCGRLGNPSRGAHAYSLEAYRQVLAAKDCVKELFHAGEEYEIAFTHNSTIALNMVLKGMLRPGDHVITTTWEHNAVLRPLYQLEKEGVQLDFISSEPVTGALRYDELEQKIRPQTAMVVCNHASNVTGNVLDIDRIKAFCQAHELLLVLDVSQSAGAYPVDLSGGVITAACFTGHKSLYGPGGTGGICIKKDAVVVPYITGGDGVHSFDYEQPGGIPGIFEAGTANVAGIIGLATAVKLRLEHGVDAVADKQKKLGELFVGAVREIPGILLYGDFSGPHVGVYALNIRGADSAIVSDMLWEKFEMATRSGFHCAPRMHEQLQTAQRGAVRFSFSDFTTEEDVLAAVRALQLIAAQPDR